MEIVTTRSMIAIFLTVGLSACGGGGGGGDSGGSSNGSGSNGGANVTPVASSGFATSGSTFNSNVTFTPTNASYTVRERGGASSVSVEPANLELVFSQNGDRLSIRVDRFNYEMDENGPLAYSEISAGPTTEQLIIESVSGNGDAKLARMTSIEEFFGDDVYFVYGFDTNPTTVTALSGTAMYTGDVFAVANQVDNTQRAGGSITLNVDFNDNEVSGQLNLNAFSGLTGSSVYDLSEADISGNNFSGTFVVSSSNPLDAGQSATDTIYDGRFFGTDGDAAGGGIGMTITESGEEPIYVQGAFLAEE